MKSEGSTGAAITARGSVDLPTEPTARPAHWPAKPRTAWTSPIVLKPADESTAAAERAAAQATAADERRRLAAIRKRPAKAATPPVQARPAARTTPAAPKPRPPRQAAPKPAPKPAPPPARRPGVLDPAEVEQLVEAGLARMTPAAPLDAQAVPRERAPRAVPAHRAEIVRLYTVELLDGRQISERLGMPYATVYSNLRAAGVQMRPPPRTPPRQPSRIDMDEARRLYAEGWTMTALGERYGVTHTRISQAFKAAGVETRPAVSSGAEAQKAAAQVRRADLAPQVRELFDAGVTYGQIAVRLDVSPTLVKRVITDLGLTRRQRLDGAEIVRLYVDERLGCETIAKRLGTVPQAVRYQLRKHGVQSRTLAETANRTDVDTVIEALAQLRAGEPVMVVAAALGIGATTVARIRDAAGIPARPSGARRRTRPGPADGDEDEGEPSPAPASRRALLDALLVERYGPAPARPASRRPPMARVAADPLPDTTVRRRVLLEAAAGASAEEAS